MDMGISAGKGTQYTLKKKNVVWQDDTYANEAGLANIGPTWTDGTPPVEDPACYKIGSKPDIVNASLTTNAIPAAKNFWIKVDGIVPPATVGGVKDNAFGAEKVLFPAAGGALNIPKLGNNPQRGKTVGDVGEQFSLHHAVEGERKRSKVRADQTTQPGYLCSFRYPSGWLLRKISAVA